MLPPVPAGLNSSGPFSPTRYDPAPPITAPPPAFLPATDTVTPIAGPAPPNFAACTASTVSRIVVIFSVTSLLCTPLYSVAISRNSLAVSFAASCAFFKSGWMRLVTSPLMLFTKDANDAMPASFWLANAPAYVLRASASAVAAPCTKSVSVIAVLSAMPSAAASAWMRVISSALRPSFASLAICSSTMPSLMRVATCVCSRMSAALSASSAAVASPSFIV